MVIHRYLQCAAAVATHFQADAALDQPVHINSAGFMSAMDAMSAACGKQVCLQHSQLPSTPDT